MRKHFPTQVFITCAFLMLGSGCENSVRMPKQPNIVVIMADDMGYSDIGSYGGEIQTPYIDLLASNGLRFTQFYNAGRCCPTRASLLTGLYPHQAGMGSMVSPLGSDPEEGAYQGYLNNRSVTLAEVLKTANYKTYMSGKWHVGENKEHWPLKRGFDRYFGLISGASSYYEVLKDQPRVRQIVHDDDVWDPPETGFYMTDAITNYATRFIRDHIDTYRRRTPFFLYVSYTAPHWPLHALPNDIAKYHGKYDIGWDSLRVVRYERLKELGIINNTVELSPRPEAIPAWEEIENKEVWSRRMEVYAAMVDRMDQGIGRIVQALDETRSLRNTIIFFLSDNGASPEDVTGRNLHDSTKTVGSRGSYDAYREPWANVSNTPFKYYKAWMHEGGIATPFIVYWPQGIQEPGGIVHEPGHVIDIMSTVVEISRSSYPDTFKGKEIIPQAGRSLMPIFEGVKPEGQHALYWEHNGRKAMRKENWKIVAPQHTTTWELYDINSDRNELDNVAKKYPDIVEQMKTEWGIWADSVGVFENE